MAASSRLTAAGRRCISAWTSAVPGPRPCHSSATVKAVSAVVDSSGLISANVPDHTPIWWLRLTAAPCRPSARQSGNRYTLLAGRPFAALGSELNLLLDRVADAASNHAGRVALTGILPTLRRADLGPDMMTDAPRYRALNSGLRRLRQAPFSIRIAGQDPLELASEGCRAGGFSVEMATTWAQVAQACPGLCGRHRRCVRPQIPGLSPGGLGPHLTSSGSLGGLSSGFPFARRVLPFVRLPRVSFVRRSPVSLRPLPVPVPRRFPSGFPFP